MCKRPSAIAAVLLFLYCGVAMALAPRKKLWSTPGSVIAEAIRLLCISADDIVLDVGAGDGRFIIACAENTRWVTDSYNICVPPVSSCSSSSCLLAIPNLTPTPPYFSLFTVPYYYYTMLFLILHCSHNAMQTNSELSNPNPIL